MDILTINDNKPRFAIQNETECVKESTSDRRRRRRDLKKEEPDSESEFVQKRKVCKALQNVTIDVCDSSIYRRFT